MVVNTAIRDLGIQTFDGKTDCFYKGENQVFRKTNPDAGNDHIQRW